MDVQPSKFPSVVQTELTNMCNSKCIMCPNKDMTRKRGIMDLELFKKIIDDCVGKPLKMFVPIGNGEPFLVPNLDDYLRYARKKLPGVTFEMYTNAALMTEDKAFNIVNEGLVDVLKISLEGTGELYNRIRVNLDWNVVKENVHNVMRLKKRLNKKIPKIVLAPTLLPENINHLKEIYGEFKDVDFICTNIMDNWAGSTGKTGVVKRLNYCTNMDEWLTILIDGKADLCCWDYDGKIITGDLKTQSVEEVWNGPVLTKIRSALRAGEWNKLPLCSVCGVISLDWGAKEDIYWKVLKFKSKKKYYLAKMMCGAFSGGSIYKFKESRAYGLYKKLTPRLY